MSIFEHIQYLITRHDCVVVAGLGAFVAQRTPARFSVDGRRLLPPGRSIVFNSALIHDDGLLTESVARRSGLSFEAARAEVARQVELLHTRMQAERSIEIPRIGRLTLTDDSRIEFIPDNQRPIADILYSALPAVTLSEADNELQPVILEVDTLGSRIGRRLLKAGKYAAIIATIVAAGATLTTPVVIDRRADLAAISLPAVTAAKKASLQQGPTALTVGMHSTDNYGPEATTKPVLDKNSVIKVSDYTGENPETEFRCFIIVGSCSSAAEAARFISRMGGNENLRVIFSDGRYRVYAAMSDSAEAAETFKSTDSAISSAFPDAWVYKRKI